MAKINIIVANLLLEAKAIKKKVDENHIMGLRRDVKEYTPTFNPSKSIINIKFGPSFHLWYYKKKYVVLLDGEPKCWEFKEYPVRDGDGAEIHGHFDKDGKVVENPDEPVLMRQYIDNVFGGLKERQEFTKKIAVKTEAERKEENKAPPISWPMLVMCCLLGAVVVLEVLTMHGVRL